MTPSSEQSTEQHEFAVALALGPVGRFISAGRRSRDLWYGSRLLAEMTKVAAFHLRDNASSPQFWTPRKETLGKKHIYFGLESYQGPVISNKIRAIVKAATVEDVRTLLQGAEQAVRGWLDKQLKQLKVEKNERDSVDPHAFEAQMNAIHAGDFLEFYAGFTKVEGTGEVARVKALKRAQELRDARKNSRIFVAPSWTRAGHVRSSLEPGRDSVLIQYDLRTHAADAVKIKLKRQIQGIRPEEKLDAIGLLRRHAAMREENPPDEDSGQDKSGPQMLPGLPFPPLSRVATDPWLEGIRKAAAQDDPLQKIRKLLVELEVNGKPSRDALHLISSPSRDPGKPISNSKERRQRREEDHFPYDASLLFEGGFEALEREVQRFALEQKRAKPAPDSDQAKTTQQRRSVSLALETLREMKGPLNDLHKRYGVPSHYYALLTADGDGVGSVLQDLKDFDQEQVLVKALDEFADNAWNIVRNHRGVAFYVGGDEVVAYLPVDTALDAARALSQDFARRMDIPEVPAAKDLTLSVGIVIAPVKHDLRDIRERAEKCLKEAKARRKKADPPKKAWIQINECIAGGEDRISSNPLEDHITEITHWKTLLKEGTISLSTAHGLLAHLERLKTAKDPALERLKRAADPAALQAGLTLALAGPLLKRKRSGKKEEAENPSLQKFLTILKGMWEKVKTVNGTPDEQKHALEAHVKDLETLANALLLASRLLDVEKQRTPPALPAQKEEQP